jgi:hypothetical protein
MIRDALTLLTRKVLELISNNNQSVKTLGKLQIYTTDIYKINL